MYDSRYIINKLKTIYYRSKTLILILNTKLKSYVELQNRYYTGR